MSDDQNQNQNTNTNANQAPDFLSTIPEVYRNEPYMKTIKSQDDLYKQFDGLQKNLGKKVFAPPGENAPQDEMDRFFKTLGRPDDFNAYEFDKAEYPEGFAPPEASSAEFKKAFHEMGLTPAQAKKAMKFIDDKTLTGLKSMQERETAEKLKADKEFDELTASHFGAEKDIKIKSASALLEAHIPDGFKEHFGTLDNKTLVMLTAALNSIQDQFISEDKIQRDGGHAPSGKSIEEQAAEIRSHAGYSDPTHPMHKELKIKMARIFGTEQFLPKA